MQTQGPWSIEVSSAAIFFCLAASWRHILGQSRPITCWGNICILRWAHDFGFLSKDSPNKYFFLKLCPRISTYLTMLCVVFTVREPEQWEEVLTQPCVSAKHRAGGRPQDYGSPGKHQCEQSALYWHLSLRHNRLNSKNLPEPSTLSGIIK